MAATEVEEEVVAVMEEEKQAKVCGASVCANMYTRVAGVGGSYVRLHTSA